MPLAGIVIVLGILTSLALCGLLVARMRQAPPEPTISPTGTDPRASSPFATVTLPPPPTTALTPPSTGAPETPSAEPSPALTPFPSPLEPPVRTPEPRAFLPLILSNPLIALDYGAKGLAGPDNQNLFGASYDGYYTWAISPESNDARLARMVWCVSDYHLYGDYGGPNFQALISRAAQADSRSVEGRVWLVFNEPDDHVGRPGAGGQCGVYPLTGDPFDRANNSPTVRESPAEAALRYSLVYNWIKVSDPNARVFAGGLLRLHSPATQRWWLTFLSTLASRDELYKVEGVHVHSYPEWSTGAGCQKSYCMPEMAQQLNAWYGNFHLGQGLGDRPIWITEIGAGDCQRYGTARWNPQGWLTVRDGIMEPISWWFDDDPRWPYNTIPTNPGYSALHWFIPWWGGAEGEAYWCTFLVDARGPASTLTPLGEYWVAAGLEPD